MNKITFYRILKNGALNYSRNFWLSLAATAVMVITLFIISSLLILGSLTNISLETIKEKVDISVYFKLDVEDSIIKQIEKSIHKGRILTPKGVSFLDKIAVQVSKEK